MSAQLKMNKKSGKRSKIHHYVPRTLQKWFRNNAGQIWFSERDEEGIYSEPEPRNTSSVFKRRDYYTVVEDGKLSDRVEKDFYGALDDLFGELLEEIHDILDSGKIPTATGDSLSSLVNVVYHLVVRNPEFSKKHDDFEVGKDYVTGVISAATKANLPVTDFAEFKKVLHSESRIRNQGRSIRVRAQASKSNRIIETLKDFSVRFVEVEGNYSFILASPCVYRIGNGGSNGIGSPDVELWLPISPKRVLVLVKDDKGTIPGVVRDSREHVRSVNEFAIRNSSQVVSHSRKLLKSLLR